MRHTEDHFSYPSQEDRARREALRKSLRIIQGGKQTPSADFWGEDDFRNDKFLRSHFLERNDVGHGSEPSSPFLWEDEPLSPWE